jgi:hypothetical protein
MELEKADIGGEIISILTRGMYADPRDSLREYIQNAIDADAKNIFIKIRKNQIVIEDDGTGMDLPIMRKAIRLGVSDKNPKDNVGFFGIGIYSAFHLCDKLDIYSKVENKTPNYLSFDFKKMREILEEQKELRINKKLNDNTLVALQELMEKNINLGKIGIDLYSRAGTRVEMININADFFKTLTKYEEVAEYIEQTVPLPFNPEFRWGKKIEDKIQDICAKQNAVFKLINLNLQINDQSSYLFRPYKDDNFEAEPLKPLFYELKDDEIFFGVAWGCMNETRATIKNKELRGFIIKRQGFSIGKREQIVKYFGRSTFFNRYIGEFIVVHPLLLPNAPRNDFEFSALRIAFYSCLRTIANKFNEKANEHQEYTKSEEELNAAIDYLKATKAQFNYHIDNADKLLEILFEIKEKIKSLQGRKKRDAIKKERLEDYNLVINQLIKIDKEISDIINSKTKKNSKSKIKTDANIIKEIKKIPDKSKVSEEMIYKSLIEIIESLGININIEVVKILQLIDEQFIQTSVNTDLEYILLLKNLKQKMEEILED